MNGWIIFFLRCCEGLDKRKGTLVLDEKSVLDLLHLCQANLSMYQLLLQVKLMSF